MQLSEINWTDRMNKAYDLALDWHCGQMYGEDYYIWHCMSVARRVAEESEAVFNDFTEDCIITAFLHDILEDTNCPESYIAAFGEDVLDAVKLLTKQEKGFVLEDYVAGVKQNRIALAVKRADAYCNLQQSIKDQNSKRIKKYTKLLAMLDD